MMLRFRLLLLFVFTMAVPVLHGQDAEMTYLVTFTDKNGTAFSIDQPEAFLSQKAIDRRQRQNIVVVEQDLPVNSDYIEELSQLNLEVVYKTKWFNGAVITTEDSTALEEIVQLNFVADTALLTYESAGKTSINKWVETEDTSILYNENYYGAAYNQLEMLNGEALHLNGYRGDGITIAVMDAGYNNADNNIVLQHLYNENRVKAALDLVDGDDQVYHRSSHGANVLTIMAGKVESRYVGSAPNADYMLFTTEDVSQEMPIEEINWLIAAEYADSAGADIITTSLGYSTFDDERLDYSYANMDGDQAFITRAADIAASKGILVLNSAGNSGNSSWFYVTAPADGDSVLAVGATNAAGEIMSFSSHGPSFDNDIKPNVVAQGGQTAVVNTSESIIGCNGTSYSCPIVAGLAACLWQANPQSSAMQVFRAIEESAHLFNTPNADYGYGIPNFYLADFALKQLNSTIPNEIPLIAYPNPFEYNVNVYLFGRRNETIQLKVTDSSGRIFQQSEFTTQEGEYNPLVISSLNDALPGTYFLHASTDDLCKTIKLVKISE